MESELSATSGTLSKIYNNNVINNTFVTEVGGALAADPTSQVILTAVPGVATTFMRSDAAPALSQAISPTMTGTWNFTPTANAVPVKINAPAALTSANMQTWSPLDNLDNVVTWEGNVGVGDEAPTANLSIRARASGITGLSPVAWFRAEDYDGTTWLDSSGNGRNLTAHTFDDGNVIDSGVQTAKPRLNAPGSVSSTPNLYSIDSNYLFSGGVTYEGLFRFDGTAMPTLSAGAGGFTIFVILRDYGNATGSENFRAFGNNSSSSHQITFQMPSSNVIHPYWLDGPADFCTNQGHTDGDGTAGGGDLERWGLRCAATTGSLRAMLDGTLIADAGDTKTDTLSLERVGHQNTFGGWRDTSICELIVFDFALTDQQMADVDTYLLARVNGESTSDLLHIKDGSGAIDSVVSAGLDWGVGTDTPLSKLHVEDASTQLRLSYDTSNYMTAAVSSTGVITLDAAGSGALFSFSDPARFNSYAEFVEMSAPATPAANNLRLYAKDKSGVSALYFKRDNGVEVDLTATGTGIATDSFWDAKGDLAVGTGADTAARLPKGTDGYFLKADSAETTGLKWVVLAGGGDALISNGFLQFAPQTSLQLKDTISDETGSGALVFANTPTLVTPILGVATATSLTLPRTTSSTTGIIFKDTATPYRWLHDYTHPSDDDIPNLFIGKNAGNFTVNGSGSPSYEGTGNYAFGEAALKSLTTGWSNLGCGWHALYNCTTGYYNFALGEESQNANLVGHDNCSIGAISLLLNTGNYNNAFGSGSGNNNTTGTQNCFFGTDSNSVVGTESNAIAIGYGTTVDASNKTVIGNLSTTVTEIRGDLTLRNQTSGSTAQIMASAAGDVSGAIGLKYKPTTALTSNTDRDWHSWQDSSGNVLQVIKADGSIEFGGRSTTGGFITVGATRTTESVGMYFIPTINTAGVSVPKTSWTAGITGGYFGPSDHASGTNDTIIGGVFGPVNVAARTHARVVGGLFALPQPGAATATYGDFWGWYVAGPGTHIGATVRTINNLAAGYVPSLHTSTTSKPLVVNNYGLAYVEEQKNATTINTGMFFANATAGYKAIMVRATSTGIGSDADGQLDLFGTTIKANGNVEFAQNQALQFRLENRTSDPGSPVAGQMWLRTDL